MTAANNGKLPASIYVELDFDFLGVIVHKVGVPITQEPNKLLDDCHKTKLPGVIGWNLIKLAYQVFINKFGQKNLENFDCPTGISPLLFSQLCVFLHNKAGGIQSESVAINTIGQQQSSKKAQQFSISKDGILGKVWIGNTSLPICVHSNSTFTFPGRLAKNTTIPSDTSCLVDRAAVNNLLQGISVNCCLTHLKGNVVPVIMINHNKHNVWIWQPLVVAEFFWVQYIPWD